MGRLSLGHVSALDLRLINFCRSRHSFIGIHHLQRQVTTTLVRQFCLKTFERSGQKVWVTEESIRNKGRLIELELSVIDTHPNETKRPTVVAIHGTPGSGLDFEPIISHLANRGIRFVSPTFPGFEPSIVEPWKLSHLNYSTEGRALLMEKLLKKMNVNRIDLLMCHSAGTWLGYKMAAEWDNIRSACFLNPCGARPHKSLRPFPLVKFVAWIMQQKSLNFFLMPAIERIYQQIGFTGIKAGEHLVVAQQIVTSQGFEKMSTYARKIRERKLPIVLAFTLNDKIIETPVPKEMLLQHLTVPESNLITFSGQLPPSHNPFCLTEDGWVARGLQFERGGHVVHKAHTDIILEQVMDLLRHSGASENSGLFY